MYPGNVAELVKKSVTLNLPKLRRLRKILQTRNDSETIRVLMDKELALRSALKANQALRRFGEIHPVTWQWKNTSI